MAQNQIDWLILGPFLKGPFLKDSIAWPFLKEVLFWPFLNDSILWPFLKDGLFFWSFQSRYLLSVVVKTVFCGRLKDGIFLQYNHFTKLVSSYDRFSSLYLHMIFSQWSSNYFNDDIFILYFLWSGIFLWSFFKDGIFFRELRISARLWQQCHYIVVIY